jgi:flavin-dependent dehydrogenase
MNVEHYDAVIVGARPAGAATAMLLARAGLDVLVVDRSEYGRDTLSTHALMRAGVLQLARWGLLEAVVAAGTPPIRRTQFHYEDGTSEISLKPAAGVDALYAPRRTVLDAVLVDAARDAGATVRYGTTATDVVSDGSCVTGISLRDERSEYVVRARLTIGADGMNSRVARLVGAATTRAGRHASAFAYGYWTGLDVDGYEWFWRPGVMGGFIPTNDGAVCVCVGAPTEGFGGVSYAQLLERAAPDARERLAHANPPAALRRFAGRPGHLRRATGPGWALVGDAGYFKDPLSTHGITDALRDAELLARAVVAGAVQDFEAERDRLSEQLFGVVDELAAYEWDNGQVRRLLLALSSAMTDEVEALAALDRPQVPTMPV